MDNYSTKQSLFLDLAKQGKNIFLSGEAGTGKSYIVKVLMNFLKEEKKKFVAIAPSGVAANNIEGQTIHSMFGMPIHGILSFENCRMLKSEKRRLLNNIEVLIIDEVSMLRPDLLDAIDWTFKKNGCGSLKNRQVIFVGDLAQLPPVLDDNSRSVLYQTYENEFFNSSKIYHELNVEEIFLDEIVRQNDLDFINALRNIRKGSKDDYFKQFVVEKPNENDVVLAPYNATVLKYNLNGLESINSKEIIFDAIVDGNAKAEEFSVESKIRVKNGAKIMYLVNSKNNPLVNGTLGTFIVDNQNYFIEVQGIKYKLEKFVFSKKEYVFNQKLNELELQEIGSVAQYPIKLAYALSIHKSQGLTFDNVAIDLTRPCPQKGQLYVALSRARTPKGLRLII